MSEIMITPSTAIDQPAHYAPSKNPALVYLASVGTSSRRPVSQSLNVIAAILGIAPVHDDTGKEITYGFVPWGVMRYEHTQAVRTQLAERYSASTGNRHLSALRGVLKDAWRLEYMTAEDHARAVDLKAIKGSKVAPAETGRHLTSGEIAALINSCYDGTKAGLRDAAIIAVGYGCGLRRSEIAGLALSDYDEEAVSLHIRNGKGKKARMTYLPDGTAEALRSWIAVRGDAPGDLFYSIRRGDNMETKGLTDQAIYSILTSRADLASVKRFGPHDLRRTFAGDLLDAGEDIATVQKMMGHSNVNTTAGYDRRPATTKKRAARKLHVPHRGQLL